MKILAVVVTLFSSLFAQAEEWFCEDGYGATATYDQYSFAADTIAIRTLRKVTVDNRVLFDKQIGWEKSFKGGPIRISDGASIELLPGLALLNVNSNDYELGCAPKN